MDFKIKDLELIVYMFGSIAYVLIILHYSPFRIGLSLITIFLSLGLFLFFTSFLEEELEGIKKEIYHKLQEEDIISDPSLWKKISPFYTGRDLTSDILEYLKSTEIQKKSDEEKLDVKPILHDIEYLARNNGVKFSQGEKKKVLKVLKKSLVR